MDKLTHCEEVTLICLLIFSSGLATHSKTLRSLNARVDGSSQHSHQFALPHAVDGSTKTVSTCSCCAATVYEKNPWMKIDLGRLYRVSIIEVTGRTDRTVCQAGTFGSDCSSTCHCLNTKSCHHVTGRCPDDRCDLGWHWFNCSLPCDKGRFGENCKEFCGNCENNAACDIWDGTCKSCSTGYIGQMCRQVCQPGRFGPKCSLICGHCVDGMCDILTGVCLQGCLPGYQGSFCQKDYNFLREASVKFSMSSVYQGLDANKAVDGRYQGIPLECRCCSETEHGGNSWWQAEFGTPEFIKQITIFWRIDEKTVRHLTGFQVLLSLSETFSDGPVYVHNNTQLHGKSVAALIQDVAAKFVRIQRAGILSICEVEVLLSDIRCPVNTYGHSCTPCGYCKNGTCDRVIGHCPGGCNENFDGEKCLTMTTLQIQPIQQTQPTQRTQPTQPTQSTQPTQPTQRTQPTQSTQPTQPTQYSLSTAIKGGMVGMAIIIAVDLIIVGVFCLIKRRKRLTFSDEPNVVSWNCRQPEHYASLDLQDMRVNNRQ